MKKLVVIIVFAIALLMIGCAKEASDDASTTPASKRGSENVELEWYGEYRIERPAQETIKNTVFSTLQSACSTSDVQCTEGWSQRKIRATLTQRYVQICIHNPDREKDTTSGCVQKDLPTPPEGKQNTKREIIKLIPEFGQDFVGKFRVQPASASPEKAQK